MYALLMIAAIAVPHNYQYELDRFVCVAPVNMYMLVLERSVTDLGLELYYGYTMNGHEVTISELDLRKECETT